jgi:hypothetical protein
MSIVDGATVTVDLTENSSNIPGMVLLAFTLVGLLGYYLFSGKYRKK